MEEKDLKALVSLLEDDDMEVVAHVEERILTLGDEVIPYLEAQWETTLDPERQKKLEDMIHVLQFKQLSRRLREWKEEGAADLLEGMWLVASFQYPDLDLNEMQREVEQVFFDAWVDVKEDMHPYDQVRRLNHVIFSRQRFRSNTRNFHAPANSMINRVLETKKGNPISLCVVYMLVGRRLGMPLYGVNLPKQFIVTYKTDDFQFYVNVFNRGVILLKEDLDNFLYQLGLPQRELFYQPASNLEIIRRVMRNLVVSFEQLSEYRKADEIKTLLESLRDGYEEEY